NIGSGCNHLAFPKLIDYAASKGGIEMLTRSTALDLGASGIRVNCIAPGAIATERTAAETDDYNDRWSALTPLGRVGTPQDVASAVLLLADEKAGFITGQTINVDGGLFSRAVWPAEY
ncbi:MAG: SDR family oxidoreductase, partial [Pseudomonadota bacterium]